VRNIHQGKKKWWLSIACTQTTRFNLSFLAEDYNQYLCIMIAALVGKSVLSNQHIHY